MQAIILAGGLGTRLSAVTGGAPKPLAPVGGKPFIHWLLDYMAGQGVTEAALAVHHRHKEFIAQLGTRFGPVKLHYYIEEEPLGTGGAIKNALERLNPTKPVLVLNGDSLVEANYRRMFAAHHKAERLMTLATRRVPNCSRYSEVSKSGDYITHFELLGEAHPGEISAGLYVVSPGLFAGYDLPKIFSFEKDFLAPYAPLIMPAAFNAVRYFIDIGVPKDFVRAQSEIPAQLMEKLAA